MWIIWPFRKKNFGSAWTVCADFHHFVDPQMGRFVIRDEKNLPHSKKAIFESMCILLMTETDRKILDTVKSCAFELAFFQNGVGDTPLHPLGADIDQLDLDTAHGKEPGRRAVSDPVMKERYDRFKLQRDADWKRMQASMAKILTKASA